MPDHRHHWLKAYKPLDNHLLEQAAHKRFFVEQQCSIEGERAGHLLASLARAQQGSSLISELRTIGCGIVSDPTWIVGEFHFFYRDLYRSRFTKMPVE